MTVQEHTEISVRGKVVRVPAAQVAGRTVVVSGRFPRIARIRDAHLIDGDVVPDPSEFLRQLAGSGLSADLLTFSEPLYVEEPRHSYPYEWDNAAVARSSNYDQWWNQLPQESRKNVRRAAKRGVSVAVVPFDEALVKGIKALYDESPIRQGRRFWHFGKDLETVRSENSSYLDRSEFIGAYHDGQLIGFMKIVYAGQIATIMQILARSSEHDKRPMNAMIAKAMEACHRKGASFLVYSKFTFGNKKNDDMAEFKRRNGFTPVTFPQYFIPLTTRGRIAFALRLHRGALGLLPSGAIQVLSRMRSRVMALRVARSGHHEEQSSPPEPKAENPETV
jgi:hypothetical protein